MVFWRSKSAKSTDDGAQGEASDASDDATSTSSADDSNVVPLVGSTATSSGKKLSDRLEDVGSLKDDRTKSAVVATSVPVTTSSLSSRDAALRSGDGDDLQKAIFSAKPGRHIIVLRAAGISGRGDVKRLAEVRAQALEAAPDWLYVLDPEHAGRLLSYSVPHGEASRFVRDATAALEKAAAMFHRMREGDEYRLSLDLIEEDARYRTDQLLDGIRRRAESQNIAVIKSLDGYMLAPMHEGRVVRQDVFRALPESLRREVEGKIKELEKELQGVVAALPEQDVEADDKLSALLRQTALRALKPNLAVVKKMYASAKDLAPVFERLEQLFIKRAMASGRLTGEAQFMPAYCWTGCGMRPGEGGDGAPVVVVRGARAEDLCGEIGRDSMGVLSLRPGDLTRANGGIVIAEAWRLAADPQGWSVLSGILERGALIPRSAPGIAVTAQPIPLAITLILLADARSLARLEDIDPGLSQYFSVITRIDDADGGANGRNGAGS